MESTAINKQCVNTSDCPFFKKFSQHTSSYKYVYCNGPKVDRCARLSYKENNGVTPPDGLAPTGILVDSDD